MHAVAFDTSFGMFHDASGDTAVVLMAPFGVEGLAAHKSLRLLAEDCARRGFPTLRFDFPGTANALGDEAEFDLIASRCAAAKQAVAWIRKQTGLTKVILIGLRLGASIAAMIGPAVQAERVVLMAPVVSGKRYLRELKSLVQLTKGAEALAKEALASDGSDQEFDGFRFSVASLAALQAMNLAALPAPAPDVLILAPDGQPAMAKLGDTWRGSPSASGARVTLLAFEGFAGLIADPTVAEPPRTDLTQVAAWLGVAAPLPRPAAPITPASLETETFIETAAAFGSDDQVFGLFCRARQPNPDVPVVILLNTGANPHYGWARQTVEVARQLAASGISSLRIDTSGIGETPDLPGRPSRVVYVPTSSADVVAAVDWLEAQGYHRPIVAGTCSGAYLAFQTALIEPRLSAIAMINLQKFFWDDSQRLTIYSSTGHYLSQLWQPALWSRLMRGEIDTAGILSTVGQRLSRTIRFRLQRVVGSVDEDSEHAKILRSFASFRARGVRILIGYTIGDGGIDEMILHLGRNASHVAGPNLRFTEIKAFDHNFTSPRDRAQLIPALRDFALESTRPASRAATAAE
ncbi:hypothetical protein SAMN05443249_3580 [Beijerinckia sp. 28-YEA-48]|nr:hypothetical protein SAMN05443249_3580 [Beijerinckia sp. 28-YEA-48]